MRKLIAITTLFLYTSLSAVQVISLHYCHDRLQSFAISETAASSCSLPNGNHTTCCEDVVIRIDFDTDHIFTEQLRVAEPFEFVIFSAVLFKAENTEDKYCRHLFERFFNEFYPPDIYKLNHSFLFYG